MVFIFLEESAKNTCFSCIISANKGKFMRFLCNFMPKTGLKMQSRGIWRVFHGKYCEFYA